MKDENLNPLEDTESEAALAYAAERRENIRTFVRTSPDYYIHNFDKIGASSRFTPTFNAMAGLFGPVWFGARGLWSWALPFLILEALGFVRIARGLFGDLDPESADPADLALAEHFRERELSGDMSRRFHDEAGRSLQAQADIECAFHGFRQPRLLQQHAVIELSGNPGIGFLQFGIVLMQMQRC